MQWRILRNALGLTAASLHKTLFLFPLPSRKKKEENESFLLFFRVNGLILYRKVFRAIHYVEKDQPPMYRTLFFYFEREVLFMMLRTAVQSARGKLGLG